VDLCGYRIIGDICGQLEDMWIFVDLCGYLWIFVDIASSLIYMLVGLGPEHFPTFKMFFPASKL
jgi:hypothetical protein